MKATEIYLLRKQGRLKEAYRLANSEVENGNAGMEIKSALGWVLYDYLKQEANKMNVAGVEKVIRQILRIGNPGFETFYFERIVDTCSYLLFKLRSEKKHTDFPVQISHAIIDLPYERPSKAHSKWLETILHYKSNADEFLRFALAWGIDAFEQNDFKPRTSNTGQKYCSLAESYTLFLAKAWLAVRSSQKINHDKTLGIKANHLFDLVDLCAKHSPHNVFLNYYKALTLLETEKVDEARLEMAYVIAQKPNDSWVWGALANMYLLEGESRIALLCKGIMCPAPDEMKVKLHEDLAILFEESDCSEKERFQWEKVAAIRQKKSWPISPKLFNRLEELKQYAPIGHDEMKNFYSEHAKQAGAIAFNHLPCSTGIITEVQQRGVKIMVNYQTGKEGKGRFRWKNTMPVAAIGQTGYFYHTVSHPDKVVYWRPASVELQVDFVKSVSGVIIIPPGKNFGFVSDVFISPGLLKEYKDRAKCKVLAVSSFDKAWKKWGWRGIKFL